MTKEEAIKVAYGIPVTKEQHEALQFLIPELRESDDERIRKGLIEVVSDIAGGFPFEKHRINKKEAIAYLEKQKEQNPVLSEEDEKELDCIINILDRLSFEEFCKSSRDIDIEEERFYYKEIQFLKRLKSLLQQGKETFAGADIEGLIDCPERKTSGEIDSVTLDGTPVPTENNAVNITPRFKVGDIIRFKGDPPSAPNHKVRVVEGDKYYLDNDTVLYLPFTAQDKWDFAVDIGSLAENDDVKTLKIKKDFWYACIKDVYREGNRVYSKGDIVKADNFMMSLDEVSAAIAFRSVFFPYNLPEEFCKDITHSKQDNKTTFTEGEVKVIKEIIDYLEYRGMEDYYESLENLILKYGGNEE